MTADKQIYQCSCGYVTHFEKALEAHCRFRHHVPMAEKEAMKAKQTVEKPVKTQEPKKVRKPRTKKAVKE